MVSLQTLGVVLDLTRNEAEEAAAAAGGEPPLHAACCACSSTRRSVFYPSPEGDAVVEVEASSGGTLSVLPLPGDAPGRRSRVIALAVSQGDGSADDACVIAATERGTLLSFVLGDNDGDGGACFLGEVTSPHFLGSVKQGVGGIVAGPACIAGAAARHSRCRGAPATCRPTACPRPLAPVFCFPPPPLTRTHLHYPNLHGSHLLCHNAR